MSLLLHDKEEDVGKIIAKVQDDLKHLHAATARGLQEGGSSSVDFKALDVVITRTEEGMQAVAEKLMQSSNNHVTTLPAVVRKSVPVASSVKSDLRVKSMKSRERPGLFPPGMSPGQVCLVKHMNQLVAQPTHPLTHKMLTSYYNLPSDGPTISRSGRTGDILVGTTVEHLTTLPKPNRRDPLLTPPAIAQRDARKGLLSLLERGLIPPAAEIELKPPPVYPRPAQLHAPSQYHIQSRIADDTFSQLAGIKLDISDPVPNHSMRPHSTEKPSEDNNSCSRTPSAMSPSKSSVVVPSMSVQTLELQASTLIPQQFPNILEKKNSTFQILIQNGYLMSDTRDFVTFKEEQHKQQWNQVSAVLKFTVDLCRNYAIPFCIMDSNRIVDLSLEYELGLKPSKEDLLSTMINRRQVQELLSIPGQRYRGHEGKNAAATKIRATYLMHVVRSSYLEHIHKKWAAGIVSMAWITFMKIFSIRQRLKHARSTQLEAHRKRMTDFRRRWSHIQSTKRTIIHLPSHGYSQSVRATIQDFHVEQSMQMGRLCDLHDANVEVIYISPEPLEQEAIDYYHSLLAMVPSGQNSRKRLHFVSPENLEIFKSHRMTLSSLLLYSPVSMSRIQRLISGREAYIISGIVSRDDLAVADKLDLPLLGTEPDVSQLYSSKAGARQLLKAAKVSIPPYEADIFSKDQLLNCLASLIADNLLIARWIFKLPDQVKGHGFAYCDITRHLSCYEWVFKEAKRYGSKWKKQWAKENALKRISSELLKILTEHAQTVDSKLYPLWTDFMKHFYEVGGIIEGVPPSDSVTPLAVELLIEPNGKVRIFSTMDQICSNSYEVWGGSVPQMSVPHSQLMDAVTAVASAAKARGILGHLSIDFITFIDPDSMSQELWCVDLDLGYSNTLALYQLMSYVTGYEFNVESGALVNLKDESIQYAVLSPCLYHTNLSLIYHSIFFQMCKAHFIGYDPADNSGTVFSLTGGKHKEYLGMICINKTLLKAIQNFSSNLSILHQEISTPAMQGSSNFKALMKELNNITDLIISNDSV